MYFSWSISNVVDFTCFIHPSIHWFIHFDSFTFSFFFFSFNVQYVGFVTLFLVGSPPLFMHALKLICTLKILLLQIAMLIFLYIFHLRLSHTLAHFIGISTVVVGFSILFRHQFLFLSLPLFILFRSYIGSHCKAPRLALRVSLFLFSLSFIGSFFPSSTNTYSRVKMLELRLLQIEYFTIKWMNTQMDG